MTASATRHWPRSGSEMGERIRHFDWSATPLGPVEDWPAALHHLLDTLLEAPLPMCVLWGEQAVQLYNDAHARLLGDDHPQALGIPVRQTWATLWPQLAPAWHRARQGQPTTLDCQPLSIVRDGQAEQAWLDLALSPIPTAPEGGVLLCIHDRTERVRNEARLSEAAARHRREAELQELNETLESRIQERTSALAEVYERLLAEMAKREQAQEALRQAQKMEAVGQLTGGIAHDFNNMLTGILGGLDLIQHYIRTDRHDKTQRFIEAAITSANRAAALTHRLLAFSRRQPLDLQWVSLNALIDSMHDLLIRTLGPHIRIQPDLQDNLWAVNSDENQLESALLNLVINARDAMPDGGTLRIVTRNLSLGEDRRIGELMPGQYVELCVSDTGCGMSPKVLASAFEPFFTTKPLGQGTGLGLSMIYGFVRQCEGHVNLSSEEGMGTEISLYLPAREREVPTVEEAPALRATNASALEESILVVEDDAAVRMLVVEVLSDLGYQVLEAAEGNTALTLLESAEHIDLLVTDVGLPGLNGRQLAELARQRWPHLHILFMTGYAEQAARSGFLEPGMELICKPFSIDALIHHVQQALD